MQFSEECPMSEEDQQTEMASTSNTTITKSSGKRKSTSKTESQTKKKLVSTERPKTEALMKIKINDVTGKTFTSDS